MENVSKKISYFVLPVIVFVSVLFLQPVQAEFLPTSSLIFENGQKTITGFIFKDIKPDWSQNYSVKITNPTDVTTSVNILLKNTNDTSLLQYVTVMVNNSELSLETLSWQPLSLGELTSKEAKNYELLFKSQNLVDSVQGRTLSFDLELLGVQEGVVGSEKQGGQESTEVVNLTEPRNFVANLIAKLPVLGTSSDFVASPSASNSANIVSKSPILMLVVVLVVFVFIGWIVASLKKS